MTTTCNATFLDKYRRFLDLVGECIPSVQVKELELHPDLSPPLMPPPLSWWINSFEWYVAVPLIVGGNYGPFYRIDGEHFWPQIGDPQVSNSEAKCFYGLEKPRDRVHAEKLYGLKPETSRSHIHAFMLEPTHSGGFLFIGPVKDRDGFQAGPNSTVVDLIRAEIVRNRVKRFELKSV